MTVVLLLMGLIVIYAIGPMRVNFMNSAYGLNYPSNYFFTHQLINVAVSVVAFVVAYKLPYDKLRKYGKWILFLGWGACLLLFVASKLGLGLAKCELGACRWINLGGLGSIQPAEILKLGLLVYLAQLAAERKKSGLINKSDFWLPAGIASAISLIFVVVLQKDLGSGVVLVAIILTMILMSGVELKKFGMVCALMVVLGVVAVVTSPHRMERIQTYINGEEANNYHIENALIAIGTGGFMGVGVGNSVQATGYLPESINDSVFAVMGETFGFVGLMTVVIIFLVLLLRVLRVGEMGADDEQRLIALGVFAWVASQMAINIMAMTGLMPLTGITLPLLSYGGTSMMFTTIALGLVLQLSCYTRREKEIKQKKFSNAHLKGGRLKENREGRNNRRIMRKGMAR